MIDVALVGAAHIHTPNFVRKMSERDDINPKYVWDHDAARAAKNAEQLGAEVAELDRIWADDAIEGVVICSETNRHQALAMPDWSVEQLLVGLPGHDLACDGTPHDKLLTLTPQQGESLLLAVEQLAQLLLLGGELIDLDQFRANGRTVIEQCRLDRKRPLQRGRMLPLNPLNL